MDFDNPKVRQAVYKHIQFAVYSVGAVIPDQQGNALDDSERTMMRNLADNMRLALVAQVLSFTLSRDYRLTNTLNRIQLQPADIQAGRILEDLVL